LNEQNPDDRGHIKLWELKKGADSDAVNFNFLGGLKERLNQESTVNCLKFSPNGQYLASCYDNNNIVLWEQRVTKVFGTNDNKVGWTDITVLPGHSD
jgi:WD40 repeat protein